MIMPDSGAPRAVELTAAEQHAAWVMVRFAAEVGYRGLHWSIPNDASWRQQFLAAVPVRHDGLLADTYELRSQRRFGSSARTVCALIRREGGFEARGVPGEEWLRPLPSIVEPRATPNANAASLAEPWLPLDFVEDDQVAPRDDRRGRGVSSVRRRRVTAAALGLLVPVTALGGGLVVANTAKQGPLPAAIPAPPAPAPALAPVQPEVPSLPVGGTQWATEARVVLASVHQQLDVLAEAEQAWAALPAERRAEEMPAPVRELVDSRARLEQQRAVLEADLAAWRALQQATASLEDTEAQLANVSRALQLGGQTAAGEQLDKQRDMLLRQRDAQREQLAGWTARMDAAVVDPLREPPDVKPLAESVIAMTEEPPAPAEPAESADSASAVVVAREPEADQPQIDDAPDGDPDDDPDMSVPQQTEPAVPGVDGVASEPVVTPDTEPDGALDVEVGGSIDVNVAGVIDISITDVGEDTTDSAEDTTDSAEDTTDSAEDTTDSAEDTTDSAEDTTGVEGEIEPADTPVDEDVAISADGDTEDIDVALDNIEIDMTLEDIQVQINGQPVSIDVVINGMGIVVDVDQLGGSPTANSGDELPGNGTPTLAEAPSSTNQTVQAADR
jgi:hypothetical protein